MPCDDPHVPLNATDGNPSGAIRRARIALLLLAAVCTAEVRAVSEGWTLAAEFRFKEAYLRFAALPGREARLGEASALLNVQPRTAANVEKAAHLLDRIAAESATDELGLSAAYLRARLEQTHRSVPNPTEARRRYANLLESAPGHPLAERSAVWLSLLELYDLADATPVEDRLAAAEARAARLTVAEVLRDHALVLARACLYFEQPPERARRHYQAALSSGVRNAPNRANALIAHAELARELGELAAAIDAYEVFLRENPRAERSHAARRRLEELRALAVAGIASDKRP